MILKGLDEAWSKVDPVQAYKDGFRFAIGYVSQDNTGKNFTVADIANLRAAGIAPALVYEFAPESALGGADAGARDAAIAISHAFAIAAPMGSALYAAVDWDVTDAQKPAVLAYANAFKAAVATVGFRSGIYGGYWVCKYLKENGYEGFLWQTYAWSGGLWYPTVNVRQTQNGFHEAGADIDIDESETVDFGQWPPLVSKPPVVSGDDMLTHWQTIQQGATGDHVRIAQGLLVGHGYSVGSTGIDGIYGPVTTQSVKSLQAAKSITVDGIFGPQTLSVALYNVDYSRA